MRKTKASLYTEATRLHQKINGGLPKNWYEKSFNNDIIQENDQVKKILKEINKIYDSRTLFEIASEAHEKVFRVPPFNLGTQSADNATALQILKSIVDGIPYNESRNEYEPITPKWRKFLD
jgi:hypothetical protein